VQNAAQSARVFRFGAFEADSVSGELRKHGIRIKLQDQPFQLLLMLLERPGELVTREEIRLKLWPPGVFVDFDQGLGTAVKKLRQALNDDADFPRYIETVPRRGYRFIAPVERIPQATYRIIEPDEQSATPRLVKQPPSPSRSKTFLTVAVSLLIAIALGFVSEITRKSLGPFALISGPPKQRPLTTLPGGAYEPALSPDGKMIAFVWGQGESCPAPKSKCHIYIQVIDISPPDRLTEDFEPEDSPAWSPDGRYIAFVAVTDDPARSGIYIAPAFGGPPRKVASVVPRRIFDRQIDWSPDGNLLAIVDRESRDGPFAIYLLSLNNGRRRQLTSPPQTTVGDTGPAFSPDGRQIVFRRTQAVANDDLYVVDVSTGRLRRLTFDRCLTTGDSWTQDGREIVFGSKRSGLASLWRVPVSGGAPRPVMGAAQNAYYYITTSRKGNRLAYSQYISNSNIWEMNAATHAVTRLLGSTRNDRSPQYSPDGKHIAFRSDRSGTHEIWVSEATGENAQRLTFFNGPLTGTPRWSPDGQFIAFDSRPGGNPDIYVVSANGGPPRRVTSSPYEDVVPSWSRDGRFIYFASNRSGSWQVWKVAADTVAEQNPPRQLTQHGGFAAFESLDGKTVFYAKGRDVPGLWEVPATGGEERCVIPSLAAGYWGYWGVAKSGLFFVRPLQEKAEIDAYDFVSRRIRRVALLDRDLPFADSGFSVDRSGTKFLYSEVDNSTSDIMLVENFR